MWNDKMAHNVLELIDRRITADIVTHNVLPHIATDWIEEAAKSGDLCIVKRLMHSEIEVDALQNAFEWATYNGCYDVVLYMLGSGKVDAKFAAPIAFARMHIPIIGALSRLDGIDQRMFNSTHSLVNAAERGHFDVVAYMYNYDKINDFHYDLTQASYETALCLAAKHGHQKVVQFLLDMQENPDHKRSLATGERHTGVAYFESWVKLNALELAAQNDQRAMVEFLINYFNRSINHRNILIIIRSSIKSNRLNIVEYLLDFYKKKKCECCQNLWYCKWPESKALFWAAHYGKMDIAKMLISRGANVNYRFDHFNGEDINATILEAALNNNHIDIANHLMECGASKKSSLLSKSIWFVRDSVCSMF